MSFIQQCQNAALFCMACLESLLKTELMLQDIAFQLSGDNLTHQINEKGLFSDHLQTGTRGKQEGKKIIIKLWTMFLCSGYIN